MWLNGSVSDFKEKSLSLILKYSLMKTVINTIFAHDPDSQGTKVPIGYRTLCSGAILTLALRLSFVQI